MDAFQAETVRLALRDMFKGSHFDICAVRKCVKITGVVPPEGVMETLSALHCIHWTEMTPEMREEVYRRVLGIFKAEEWQLEELEVPLIGSNGKNGRSFLQRLLSTTVGPS